MLKDVLLNIMACGMIYLSLYDVQRTSIINQPDSITMAQTLVDQALGVMVVAIVIGAVAMPTAADALVTELEDVSDENYQPDSLPENITLNQVEDGIEEDSEEVDFYDESEDSNTTLEKDSEYKVHSYQDGELELLDEVDYNSSEDDQFYVDYQYKPLGTSKEWQAT